MKRILILVDVLLIAVKLFAGAASPLIKPDSGNLVDIGYHSPQKQVSVPKVWSQYVATLENVERAIIGKGRVYSDPVECVSDEHYIENCPWNQITCTKKEEYSRGYSVKNQERWTYDSWKYFTDSCLEGSSSAIKCEEVHDKIPAEETAEIISASFINNYEWLNFLQVLCSKDDYTLIVDSPSDSGRYCEKRDETLLNFDFKDGGYCYWGETTKIPECTVEAVDAFYYHITRVPDWDNIIEYTNEDNTTYWKYEFDYEYAKSCNRDEAGDIGSVFQTGYFAYTCRFVMNETYICPSDYSYSSSNDRCYKFIDRTYSCPAGYVGPDADNMCTKESFSCPVGYTGPDQNGTCSRDGFDNYFCGNGALLEKNSETQKWECVQMYYYYDYLCPTDVNAYEAPWEISNEGGNCQECLGEYGCECNSELPPVNNCHRSVYRCPYDSSRLCTKIPSGYTDRPMVLHTITGTGFVPEEYGVIREAWCGSQCDFGVSKITTNGNEICFFNRTGNEGCFTVDGCEFNGDVDTGTVEIIGSILTTGGTDPHGMNFFDQRGTPVGTITSTCKVNGGVGSPGVFGNIISIVPSGDQLWMWDSYAWRGDIGLIEFVREVKPEDAAEGYKPAPPEPYLLRSLGFDRIYYYDKNTYAAAGPMSDSECNVYASKSGFSVLTGEMIEADENISQMIINYYGGGTTLFEDAVCNKGVYDWGEDACIWTEMVYPDASILKTGDYFYCNKWGRKIDAGKPDYEKCSWEQIADDLNSIDYDLSNSREALGCLDTTSSSCCFLNDGHSWGSQASVYWPACPQPETVIQKTEPTCPSGSYRSGMYCIGYDYLGDLCVLTHKGDLSFQRTSYAQKNITSFGTSSYACSPYVCTNHKCQKAECYTGYTGNLIPVDMGNLPDPSDCTAQVCDANQAHYEFCGKYKNCPVEIQGVHEDISGNCKRTVCSEGGYNEEDHMCYKWQCPSGTIESGGECIVI